MFDELDAGALRPIERRAEALVGLLQQIDCASASFVPLPSYGLASRKIAATKSFTSSARWRSAIAMRACHSAAPAPTHDREQQRRRGAHARGGCAR